MDLLENKEQMEHQDSKDLLDYLDWQERPVPLVCQDKVDEMVPMELKEDRVTVELKVVVETTPKMVQGEPLELQDQLEPADLLEPRVSLEEEDLMELQD